MPDQTSPGGPPTRPADRNRRAFAGDADGRVADQLLPSLESGVTLLDVEGSRGVALLQSLVLDHLLTSDGPAYWVDAQGHATTTSLARLAPHRRLLERVHVARGFTAYQHYAAVADLPAAVNRQVAAAHDRRGGREAGDGTPALVVAPAVDAQYRGDDAPRDELARTLQARTLARLDSYADGYDVPVLVTRTADDAFTAPVAATARHHLAAEQTRFGPRFVGDEFETLCYPVGDGSAFQTTIAYWRELLGARADAVGYQPSPAGAPGPGDAGAGDVGTARTVDGQATMGADPLLDAWTASAGGR